MTHGQMRELLADWDVDSFGALSGKHGVLLATALRQVLDETQGGVALIAAERQRQIESEGWTAEHDDDYCDGVLARAGACYAEAAYWPEEEARSTPEDWPFDPEWWKPSPNPIRNLVKAGALIAAEIDRLFRMQVKP